MSFLKSSSGVIFALALYLCTLSGLQTPIRHHHSTGWEYMVPIFSKINSGFTCPALVNSYFFVMMIHVFLIYFSLIKYTVLGFLKTRLCFFGCYHVSRGFSLAWLLTFTKSFASIACQWRSWFVSYQNTKRSERLRKR